jgi:hypothetical protein
MPVLRVDVLRVEPGVCLVVQLGECGGQARFRAIQTGVDRAHKVGAKVGEDTAERAERTWCRRHDNVLEAGLLSEEKRVCGASPAIRHEREILVVGAMRGQKWQQFCVQRRGRDVERGVRNSERVQAEPFPNPSERLPGKIWPQPKAAAQKILRGNDAESNVAVSDCRGFAAQAIACRSR